MYDLNCALVVVVCGLEDTLVHEACSALLGCSPDRACAAIGLLWERFFGCGAGMLMKMFL
jgi:hypothetical protein